MYNHILYLLYWLVNSALIFVSSIFFPLNVSLTHAKYSPVEASIYAGFWLTFVIWSAWDFFVARKIKVQKDLKTIITFWGINIIGVYFISHLPGILGVWIDNLGVIILIAFSANLGQRYVWGLVTKRS